MRIGDLRRRVTIRARSNAQSSFGQQTTSWSTLLTGVPAEIVALQGRELQTAGARNAEASHTFTLRYHPLLADPIKVAGMQIVYVNGGVTRYFNITGALNIDERNKTLELTATEGLSPG